MKILILLPCFVACALLLKGQDAKLKGFKVIAVTFGITTPMSVSCSEFEKSFPSKNYATQNLDDSAHVSQLGRALSRVEFAKNESRHINVRAKVYLEYGNAHPERVLCVDKFYDVELDGRLIKRNKTLVNYLKQFLKSSE
jgi:hypothetical protein